MTRITLTILVAMTLLGSGAAHAQSCVGAHCDVLVARLMTSGDDCVAQIFDPSQTVEYSQLVTGARDFGVFPIANLHPVYVFDERLDGSYSADDPGFTAVANPCATVPEIGPLPPSRGLYTDFLTEPPTAGGAAVNLLYWDGVDDNGNGLDEFDVDWSPVPIDEIMRLDELGVTAVADGSANEIEGILIETTGASGNIHDHIDFELRRAGGGLPTVGIYLTKIDLTVPGFAEGAPAYFVFATIATPAGSEFVARTQVENQLVFSLCDDGIDNDRDGFIDFAGGDPGCDDADDDSEKSPTYECDDGIDNDGDGFIDYRAVDFGSANLYAARDPECDAQGATGVSEVPEPGSTAMLAAGITLLSLIGRRRAAATARRA